MNIKHYVINLKRRPDKLWAWIGAMDCFSFPFQDLTIFEAIDEKSFDTNDDIIEYANKLGFPHYYEQWWNRRPKLPRDFRGAVCLKLGIDVLLRNAAKSDVDWSIIWLDDVILFEKYSLFEFEISRAPGDCEVIFPAKHLREQTLTVDRTGLWFKGPLNGHNDFCIITKPTGAVKLLEIGFTDPIRAYGDILRWYKEDMSFIYTPVRGFVDHRRESIFVVPTDLREKPENTPLRTMKVEDFL